MHYISQTRLDDAAQATHRGDLISEAEMGEWLRTHVVTPDGHVNVCTHVHTKAMADRLTAAYERAAGNYEWACPVTRPFQPAFVQRGGEEMLCVDETDRFVAVPAPQYLILNAAMVPNEGTFQYRLISEYDAAIWLAKYAEESRIYVGYPQTATHLGELWRQGYGAAGGDFADGRQYAIPLNRAKCTMAQGDEALVCRLAYRVDNPATKGQPQPDDWEYGILRRLQEDEVMARQGGEIK